MNTIIIVSLESSFFEIKQLLSNVIVYPVFNFKDLNDIVTTIFTDIIVSMFNSIRKNDKNLHNSCCQGSVDYLEYQGLSHEDAFKIVHASEMTILKAVFDICPILDDTNSVKILDYHFVDKHDLFIIVKFNLDDNVYEKINNNSNYNFAGIV